MLAFVCLEPPMENGHVPENRKQKKYGVKAVDTEYSGTANTIDSYNAEELPNPHRNHEGLAKKELARDYRPVQEPNTVYIRSFNIRCLLFTYSLHFNGSIDFCKNYLF
jgi:hypothetical protein